VWAGRLRLDTTKGETSAHKEVTQDLRPGVWEICVTSDRPDEVSTYDLEIGFSGLRTDPAVVTAWNHPIGKTPSGELEVTNLFVRPVHAKLSGKLEGYRQTVRRTIQTGSDTVAIPVVFSKGIRAVRVRGEMASGEYALFTDVAITLVDAAGKAIFKDGFPSRSFDREMDSPGGDAACTLKIVGAFTHAHGSGKAELKIRIDYLYVEPVSIALTRGGNAETTLYPGIPVPLRFSLASAPTAVPDGTHPVGYLEVRDKARDATALRVPLLIER
jgi:hypothetical protein